MSATQTASRKQLICQLNEACDSDLAGFWLDAAYNPNLDGDDRLLAKDSTELIAEFRDWLTQD